MLNGITNIKPSEVLKELKDYIEDLPHYSSDEVAEALEIAIKSLEQGWIPVSERLPEKDGYYYVIDTTGKVCTYVFHKQGNSEEYWKRCAIAWRWRNDE